MKVGIITFHDAVNYGAVLQAYALQEAVREAGGQPQLVNYCPDAVSMVYRPLVLKKYRAMARDSAALAARQVLADLWHFRTIRWRNRLFQDFCREHLHFSGPAAKTLKELRAQALSLDVCFSGSDQVWNPEITGGFDPAYFLDFGPENMVRASYAASLGKASFSQEERSALKQNLARLDAISVRERTGAALIRELEDREVRTHLDPTLLLTQDQWRSKLGITGEDRKYLFVYTLYPNPELDRIAQSISCQEGLEIVTLNLRKRYGNNEQNRYFSGPGDFVRCIANAQFVVTNSFHGTAFALNFSKRFVTVLGGNRTSRVTDLLEMLGLRDRAVRSYGEYALGLREPDYARVREKLDRERERGMEYIRTVMKRGTHEISL